MEISVSIVLYHNPVNEVYSLLESILGSKRDIRIYIMDNSMNDQFRYLLQDPQVEYIYCGKNLGYGGGHNLAIEKARHLSKYHVIMNPDIILEPEVLDELFTMMEDQKDIGLVMPKVLYKNGAIQYLCKKLPSPSDLFLRRFIPPPVKLLFKKALNAYELRDRDYEHAMEVPNLSGCFMFIRTNVFEKIGLFDTRYFMYMEDTDLCRRIGKYFRTVYYPNATIIHGYAKASYKNLKLSMHHIRSSIRYFNKWGWFRDHERLAVNNSIRYVPLARAKVIKAPSMANTAV